MLNNFKNPKTILYITISTIIVILVIVFFVKKYIRNKPPKAIDVPDDIDINVNTFNAELFADKFYNDIKGIGIQKDTQLYSDFLSLSNANAVKVMNAWDKKYYKKWQETLYAAFSKEKFLLNVSVARAVLNRLENLEKLRM